MDEDNSTKEESNYKTYLLQKYPEDNLEDFFKIERKDFLPSIYKTHAEENKAFPIGEFKKTNKPETDYLLFKALKISDKKKYSFLELGTGSGYFTALLSMYSNIIITIEKNRKLCGFSQHNLKKKDLIKNIKIVNSDAFNNKSYKNKKFDRIIFTFVPKESFSVEDFFPYLEKEGLIIFPSYDKVFIYTSSLKEKPFLIEELHNS
ncbi:MAG: rRNA adenine N-6-methyltransferase family protein [Nanobdellota archaeon]